MIPQLVVLYKFSTTMYARLPLPYRLLMSWACCCVLNVIASHATVSMPQAMATAARQFRFPAIHPLLTTGPVAPGQDVAPDARPELSAAETAPTAQEIVQELKLQGFLSARFKMCICGVCLAVSFCVT
jgi:hypothetical protein